jgi:hypothetical protein
MFIHILSIKETIGGDGSPDKPDKPKRMKEKSDRKKKSGTCDDLFDQASKASSNYLTRKQSEDHS